MPVAVGLRLFLPEVWTGDPDRMARAGVPEDLRRPRTKAEIALAEIDRVRAEGARFGCWPMPATAHPPCSGGR